jgi:hypothetical protein
MFHKRIFANINNSEKWGGDMNVKCKILNVKCKSGIKEIKSSFSHEKPHPQPLSNREGSKEYFY